MKATLGILAFLILATFAALHLPMQIRLELYDVQDVTSYMPPFVDRDSLVSTVEPELISDEELAGKIRGLLPGSWNDDSGRAIQGQNGLLIVRTTTAQQIAIRAYLAAYRAKTTLSATLFGIIRK